MTVGQALERAEELRPGSRVTVHTRQEWLREADACCGNAVSRPATDAFDTVGADRPGTRPAGRGALLAPAPFDALYPH